MSQKSKLSHDYFLESGKAEIRMLRKHFHIIGTGDNVRIAGEITTEDITDFFREYLARVRPPNLGDEKIFPKSDPTKLRSLYMGSPDANILLNVIVRHILYVDQVLIVDPFLTLIDFEHPKGPMKRPEMWVQVLANRALCLCALEDWVKSGLILIFPNVFYYHPEKLRIPDKWYIGSDQKQAFEKRLIRNLLVKEHPEVWDSVIDTIVKMGKNISTSERTQLFDEVHQYAEENPIRFRFPERYFDKYFGKSETVSTAQHDSTGLPMAHASEIAEIVGAFLIFEDQFFYDTLCANVAQRDKKSDLLQQLSLAFQKLDFPFLHNVPSQKALELRKKGYLLSFRKYLHELWVAITSINDNRLLNEQMNEFRERLEVEYSQLEREWEQIRKDLYVSAVMTGIATGVSVVSGNILLGLVPFVVGNMATPAHQSIKDIRQTYEKPLGIFLKLGH